MSTATAAPTAHPLWFLDNLAYVHVAGNQSGESFSLSELVGARGNMPPLHVHHRDDETFYVIAGEVTLFYGHQEVSVGPGQALLAPRDIPHTYRVDSDRARWLVINSPSGFEQFLFEASEPAPSPELRRRDVRPIHRRSPKQRPPTTSRFSAPRGCFLQAYETSRSTAHHSP